MATQPHMFPEIESPDFVRSDEVADVAETALRKHGSGTRLTPIAEAVRDDELSILYLVNEKPFNPDTEDEDQPEISGRCVKAPGIWRDVTGYHFAIWVRRFFWDQYDEPGREALLLHELLHIEVEHDKNGQAKFSTRKHDVEDFVDVARQYGPSALAGDGARYVRAAAVFLGAPEPIGHKPIAEAVMDAVEDAAERGEFDDPATGTTVTVARHPSAVTPDDRVGKLECQGSNHVPGHTAGCPQYVAPEGQTFDPRVGDPLVVAGVKVRIKTIAPDGFIHAKAAFGDDVWEGSSAELTWDDGVGVWRGTDAG